jgi:hypothetical protein
MNWKYEIFLFDLPEVKPWDSHTIPPKAEGVSKLSFWISADCHNFWVVTMLIQGMRHILTHQPTYTGFSHLTVVIVFYWNIPGRNPMNASLIFLHQLALRLSITVTQARVSVINFHDFDFAWIKLTRIRNLVVQFPRSFGTCGRWKTVCLRVSPTYTQTATLELVTYHLEFYDAQLRGFPATGTSQIHSYSSRPARYSPCLFVCLFFLLRLSVRFTDTFTSEPVRGRNLSLMNAVTTI